MRRTSSRSKTVLCLAAVVAFCASSAACSEADSAGAGEKAGEGGGAGGARVVAPYQIVALTLEAGAAADAGMPAAPPAALTKDSYPATLGDEAVRIVRVTDAIAVFVVPAKASGSKSLRASLDDRVFSEDFTIRPVDGADAAVVSTHLAAVRAGNAKLAAADAASPALAAAEDNLHRAEDRTPTLAGAELDTVARIVRANEELFSRATALATDGKPIEQLESALGTCGAVVAGGGLLADASPDSGALAASAVVAHCGARLFGADASVMSKTQRIQSRPSIEDSPDSARTATFVSGITQKLQFRSGWVSLSPDDLKSSTPSLASDAKAVDAVARLWPSVSRVAEPDLPLPPALGSVEQRSGLVDASTFHVDPKSVTNGVRFVSESASGTYLELVFALSGTWPGAKDFSFTLTHENGLREPDAWPFDSTLYHGEGCGAGQRFVIEDEGSGPVHGARDCMVAPFYPCTGTGLVHDTQYGGTWERWPYSPGEPPGLTFAQASAYCSAKGMRVPTLAEIAQIRDDLAFCAFPQGFWTWTTQTFIALGDVQRRVVEGNGGGEDKIGENGSAPVLCVK
jgi:hypothetical protein